MLERLRYFHRYAYLWAKQRQVRRFIDGAQDCPAVQHQTLLRKIQLNRDSDFGREHGFANIRSLEDFRRQVPIATYEYYRSYVDQVKRGRTEAMFGPDTKVLMFSMSSGTTSESKYIPITNHFFQEYRRSWNLWGLAVFRDHPDLVTKYLMNFGSDWEQFHTEAGIPCGNISGLVAETRPRISNPVFILPAQLNKISGTEMKQYVALRLALVTRRIGMIGTANPLTLLNFARLADRYRESLIRDVHDGSLSDHVEMPSPVREALDHRLRRGHPRRARELEQIIERTGSFYPKDFWPQLSVLSVWSGAAVGVYLPKVTQYYGSPAIRDHGLSASEGHIASPLEDGTSAGLVDYTSHFYEFIPEEEHESDQPVVLEAHQLEVGKTYYILLTTLSGLYRYDIHDVVRCVGFVGQCPIIDFVNKGSHFSSMTGEKLNEHQVTQAVPLALADVGLSIEHFCVVPVQGDPARYVLLIEEELDENLKQQLAQRVDMRLCEANCEYDDRLSSNRLRALSVKTVPHGTWAKYQAEKLSGVGASDEAYKHPFLATRPELVDKLLGRTGA